MTRRIVTICVVVLLAISMSSTWAGRPDKGWKNWFGHFSGGYVSPQSDLGDVIDSGWMLNGGATYWPESWVIGIDMDLAYSDYDVSRTVIDSINDDLEADGQGRPITGGSGDIWTFSVNGMWSTKGSVQFYVIGGIGAYRSNAKLGTAGLVFYPPVCGWYWCYPGGWAPGTVVAASTSSTDFGWNAGVGVSFAVGANDSQIYVEGRYHSWEVNSVDAGYVPIVLGYRW